MAQNSQQLTVQQRYDTRKSAARRLRRQGMALGIIYGGEQQPMNIMLPEHILRRSLQQQAMHAQVIQLSIIEHDKIIQQQSVLLKAVQRHAYKANILHFDLQRVTDQEILHHHVTLHTINEATALGIKQGGGTLIHHLKDVEIICPAMYLPEYITVDVQNLDINQTLHLSDLTLPEHCKIAALLQGSEHDQPVVSIQKVKASADSEIESKGEGTDS